MTMASYSKYICSRPFKWFEIIPNGDVYMCCPAWLPKPIGNILRQSVDEIWNSKEAQHVRQSMFDGTFRYCNNLLCPYLQLPAGPVQKKTGVRDKDLRLAMNRHGVVLPYGPRTINCSFDRSCNLSCPTCREHAIVTMGKDKNQVLQIIDIIQKDLAKDIYELYITGSGDPFGSPNFFTWLKRMKPENFPSLKNIHLHTNGQLFTPTTWQMIADIHRFIHSVEISIDAATAQTYTTNRRGGDFKRLMDNLAFIQKLRSSRALRFVCISFVVQANNFREIPLFVQIRKKFGFDIAYFSQLVNWGTFTPEEYLTRAVHLPQHPLHSEFRSIMSTIKIHPTNTPGNRTNISFSSNQTERKQNIDYIGRQHVYESAWFEWFKKIELLVKTMYTYKT